MLRRASRFLLTFAAGGVVAAAVLAALAAPPVSAARYQDLDLFTSVLNLVRKNYVEPVDEQELIYGAVKGMLAELDPHSSFLTPEVYQEMQIDTKGEFAGLGIEIAKSRDGFIEVVSPIDGTPAQRAGVQARDQIVAICPTTTPADWPEPCRGTKNMTLVEAVQLMRGPKGSEITIKIFREGFEKPQSFAITRDLVKVKSVAGKLLEDGYGYVRVRAFQERTARDLKKKLSSLAKNGPLGGLVIDLRDNPGGLLDQAVKVSDIWLSDGLIVYTQGRVESQRQEFRATASGTEPDYPIVVLVNGGTASASEIVAGALQDHRRALVLGTETFGKGSVQTIIPLEGDAGLRLTTALYYTPAARSIQETGIAPDITVESAKHLASAEGTSEDKPSRRIRERDLERHFTQEDARGKGKDGDADKDGFQTEDPQLRRAVDVLKSWNYFERLRAPAPTQEARATPAD